MSREKQIYSGLLLTIALSMSGEYSQASEYISTLKTGVEQFSWTEHSNGKKLLAEKGKRSYLGLSFAQNQQATSGVFKEVEFKLYTGDVDYDGHTQRGKPIKTDTEYSGFMYDAEIGKRIKLPGESVSWDFLGGVNLNHWKRDLQDSSDADGEKAFGYQENYKVFSAKLATGPVWFSQSWKGSLQLGVKLPVYSRETVDLFGITLKPEGTSSYYLKMHNAFHFSETFSVVFDIYYDTYRFDKSKFAYINTPEGTYAFHQPQSAQQSIGFQLGFTGIF